MADVDRGRKRAAQERRGDRARAVGQQRGPRLETVAGGLRALQILQRADHVEQRHGKNHGQILPTAAVGQQRQRVGWNGNRPVQPHRPRLGPRGEDRQSQQAQPPRQADPGQHRDQAARQAGRKSVARRVRDQHEQQRHDRDQRMGEDLEEKHRGQKGDRDPGQRGQQRGARRMAAQPVADERAAGLQHPAQQAGEQPELPREPRVLRLLVHRPHHQKNIGEQAGRIDAVRQRGHVGATGLVHQAPRLPRIEHVADQDGHRGPGQDAADHQILGKPAHQRPEDRDQHELQQIVDEQAEEAVDVAAHEVRRSRRGRGDVRHGRGT